MIRPPAYSDMLQNYYGELFMRLRRERQSRLAAVDSPQKARHYVSLVRQSIRDAFDLPGERTPLYARVTASEEADGVRTEAVLYEPRPCYLASALLFRPAGKVDGKLPAVLGLCGHSQNGKSSEPYRIFCRTLARAGFIVLLPDPAGQGERLQFIRTPGDRFSERCCDEHNQLGKMLGLFGDNFAFWRVWDAMRGLDYLLSRPEADSSRVGVTGNSGGGTLSTYLWALDDRLTMAAPGCYITSFHRNFDNELPVDAEQAVPGIAAAGIEMADFLIARAPSPCLVLGRGNDFFDPRGTKEAVAETGRIYELLGGRDHLAFHVEPGDHGYGPGNRRAMYRFFMDEAGIPGEVEELSAGPELFAAPDGQVNWIPGSRTLPEFLSAWCGEPVREPMPVPAFLTANGIVPPAETPDYKVLRNGYPAPGRVVSVYGVRSEGGILAFLHTCDCRPLNIVPEGEAATLLVAARDAEEELLAAALPADGSRLFTLDARGFGKSFPLTGDRDTDFFTPYGTEYFYDAAGVMLDSPLFSGRARDVLAALAVLRAAGYRSIRVIGRGVSSLFTAFGCCAGPELWESIELEEAPASMRTLVRKAIYREPQSFAPRGMLRHFDLAEVYAELAVGHKVKIR